MNWEILEKEVKALAEKIDFQPDIIVGIVRGGLIPARLLSSYLGVKKMYCLSVEKSGEERQVITEIKENISGKKIILVEDMLETGRSLMVAKNYLESLGAMIKTACLYTIPVSEIKPDYSLNQITEAPKFPWE